MDKHSRKSEQSSKAWERATPPAQSERRQNRDRNASNQDRRSEYDSSRHQEPLPSETSPWLHENAFPEEGVQPHDSASFVEYLRWMRSPNHPYKEVTKVQILQMAEERGDYFNRLDRLTRRTRAIAEDDNCFEATCSWRIRVGGHRGPESTLLPAFDALGIPYIPSSTLRGIARTQAIREFMAQGSQSWKEAESKVAPYFGALGTDGNDRAGKVIFLDAYPLPQESGRNGGLSVDMTNHIWAWEEDNSLKYAPNPNPFFSLKETTFLIAIRPTTRCNAEQLDNVKRWLKQGLQAGVGSQINTGYGSLCNLAQPMSPFFSVDFTLKGQLIHSRQYFQNVLDPYQRDRDGNLKRDQETRNLKSAGIAEAEIRPGAFKSMLRYWFRALALGVLPVGTIKATENYQKRRSREPSTPLPAEVRSLEAILFGSITPQSHGWLSVQVINHQLIQSEPRLGEKGRTDPCGQQSGSLLLKFSSEMPQMFEDRATELFKQLTWLMFHLGGIGQGARRPVYSRKTRQFAPWWRGSSLLPISEDEFWMRPNSVTEFQQLFQQRLEGFYKALEQLICSHIDPRSPLSLGTPSKQNWWEAIDRHCQIVVCSGKIKDGKPYALSILHSNDFKLKNRDNKLVCNPNLCGKIGKKVKPSPVWIVDFGRYQVVTAFGITGEAENPRSKYLRALKHKEQIWPI